MSSILDKRSVRRAALPITVEQYHRLTEEAIIPQQTELFRGVIIAQMTKSPLHTYVVHLLAKWLESVVDADPYVRKDEPLTLDDSELEPDIALVRGGPSDWRTRHPGTADLVIEVALATPELDREKASLYAAAGVPEYWIVLPADKTVEVYRNPTPAGYRDIDRCADVNTLLRPRCLAQASIRLGSLFE